jgi:hypothetical protein
VPRFILAAAPGLDVGLDYLNNGRVNGLYAVNSTGATRRAVVTLTDGRQFGQDFPPGETTVNFPANAVTIAFPSPTEVTLGGVAGYVVQG